MIHYLIIGINQHWTTRYLFIITGVVWIAGIVIPTVRNIIAADDLHWTIGGGLILLGMVVVLGIVGAILGRGK